MSELKLNNNTEDTEQTTEIVMDDAVLWELRDEIKKELTKK
jgi:hypothetical protein